MAREVFPKLGWKKPVLLHHHLIPGLAEPEKNLNKEDAVIAGLEEATIAFTFLGCNVQLLKNDGEFVKKRTPIMQIFGSGKNILKGERTALNILMRMTGIATTTHKILTTARKTNPKIRIACTRKTAPGLRYLDKKAVELGGGDTHRLRLDDCILIKDNHLRFLETIKNGRLEKSNNNLSRWL